MGLKSKLSVVYAHYVLAKQKKWMDAPVETSMADFKKLIEKGASQDFSFIEQQSGMFSFLGINKAQVQSLVQDYSIYLVDSSRINIAGISLTNVDYLAESIVAVLNQKG